MDPARLLAPPGTAIVDLAGQRPARRYLARAADHVLVVVTGRVEVGVGPGAGRRLGPGAAVVCPRGVAWSVRPDPGARLVVVAVPGGSEEAVAGVLRDPGADDAALVALAADGGLELLLAPAAG
jgi:mannose-6-phosphate isomerase-like protein (cupin superfamily)